MLEARHPPPSARAAFFALSALVAGCAPDAARRPDIILFTVDTLRADRLGAYGNRPGGPSPSPFADELAQEGVRFERCFAPRGMTHPALASLLTGKHPASHGLRENGLPLAAKHVPFPVLLKQAGYRTAGFAANLDVTRWPFWLRGLDVAEDGVGGALDQEAYGNSFRYQRVWDERVTEKALAFIERLPDERSAPLFLWVHLYDVHSPYTPGPDALALFADPAYQGPLRDPAQDPETGEPADRVSPLLRDHTLGHIELGAADLAQVRALYDAGVFECDQRLARIAQALRRKGRFDDALVIYTADHGDELADHHRYFYHGNSIYDATLHVPLILRWPGRLPAGATSGALAQLLDLFPTVLEAAEVAPPAGHEAWSLLAAARGGAGGRPFAIAEWEDRILAVSDGEWKYIHNPGGVRPARPPYPLAPGSGFPYQCFELYDLTVDAAETANRYDPDHPRLLALRREARRFLDHPDHQEPMLRLPSPDPGLEALGYLGHASGRDVVTIDCGDQR